MGFFDQVKLGLDVAAAAAKIVGEAAWEGVKSTASDVVDSLGSSDPQTVHGFNCQAQQPLHDRDDYCNCFAKALFFIFAKSPNDNYLKAIMGGCCPAGTPKESLLKLRKLTEENAGAKIVRSATVEEITLVAGNMVKKAVWNVLFTTGHTVKIQLISPQGQLKYDGGLLSVGYSI